MKPLHVITFGRYLDIAGYEIVFQTMKEMYKSVTPKHRRNLRLIFIDDFSENAFIWKKAEACGIEQILTIVNKNLDQLDEELKESSVLLMPGERVPIRLISKCFSFSLPVIGYHHLRDFEMVDQTCSMLVRYRSRYQATSELTQMLNILYFDPELRKILKRGTHARYQSHFRWGQRERV